MATGVVEAIYNYNIYFFFDEKTQEKAKNTGKMQGILSCSERGNPEPTFSQEKVMCLGLCLEHPRNVINVRNTCQIISVSCNENEKQGHNFFLLHPTLNEFNATETSYCCH